MTSAPANGGDSAPHEAVARRLPLFPLKTVLFPGGLLPLKIFEQRYIEMAKSCLRDGSPFGICLITRGDEVALGDGDVPDIASFGTFASVRTWDMPQLGILHVVAQGGTRFRISSHDARPNGLIVGDVAAVAAEPRRPLGDAHRPLAELLQRIADDVGPNHFPSERAFDDATWVGYRLAELLPLPLALKQELLESDDAPMRLEVLHNFIAAHRLI